ncbi:hypothetical protein HK100_002076 [Physocladia obscura]|uniref:tRNA (guanine(10)-N(2))-methyltransferase n=1 Tax=Physocladia obscura TaxID=109957 RepID=A0AAD5XEF5_9FUNG|nr:hypothetical protein HK100_002076 [Physocladia obscura]
MKDFVFCFAQTHLNFRLAELNALAILEAIEIQYNPSDLLLASPFLLVKLPSIADAKKLLNRSILLKEVIELWAEADTFDNLLVKVRELPIHYHKPYLKSRFKFNVSVFGSTLTIPQKVEQIERFSFLPYEGDIDMKNPEVVFTVYEDFYDLPNQGIPSPEHPFRLFFGPFVAESNRGLIQKYDLKKRGYLGTTSMDAELSLIMSNVALVRPGSFVLDPFVGTGSFLVTSSHFGAYTLGADIDGRQIRGKAHHPWRTTEFWDAIICDPPYGVRAGAKKIAINSKTPPKTSILNRDGGYKLPQTIPYELDEVLNDLISFAAIHLVPGGRLVYWLPTITEEYSPRDVPRHRRLRLLDNCEQNFNKWARRLIVMEKLRVDESDLNVSELLVEVERGLHKQMTLDTKDVKIDEGGLVSLNESPAHANFRKGYFNE